MTNHQLNCRRLAEKATKEQDPEKLMAIVEELTGVLAQREAVARERRKLASGEPSTDPKQLS